jgi:hypothetical protein
MMYSPYKSNSLKHATVTAVDLRRKVAKCLGDNGDILREVIWSGLGPKESDRVLVDVSTGMPIIIGLIPSDTTEDIDRQNITLQANETLDIADYSMVDVDIKRGSTPKDQSNGDEIVSNQFGLYGLLRLGSFIAKSSALSQILTSRLGDLVRIVSRNFDHFTEVDSVQKNSIRGRLYSKKSLYRDPAASHTETPSLVEYEGAVIVGEALEAIGSPREILEADFPVDPEDDGVMRRTYTYTDVQTSVEDLYTDGKRHRIVQGDNTLDTVVHNGGLNHTLTTASAVISYDVSPTGVALNVKDISILVNTDGTMSISTTGAATLNIGGSLDVTSAGLTFQSSENISMSTPKNVTIAGAQIHWNKS